MFKIAVMLAAAIVFVPCGGDTDQATPTSTSTSTLTSTSTPRPVQEWSLEDVRVEGSTVTVSVRVFAGIGFDVILDGAEPSDTSGSPPILEFVFRDVSAGPHSIRIRDVVGYVEDVTVVVLPTKEPDGPLDTALAEVLLVSSEEGLVTLRVDQLLRYYAFPDMSYERLAEGDAVVVSVYGEPVGGMATGARYLASLSLCLDGLVGGLECAFEGWSAALFLLPPAEDE